MSYELKSKITYNEFVTISPLIYLTMKTINLLFQHGLVWRLFKVNNITSLCFDGIDLPFFEVRSHVKTVYLGGTE